jgi:hypothetical protein
MMDAEGEKKREALSVNKYPLEHGMTKYGLGIPISFKSNALVDPSKVRSSFNSSNSKHTI